MTLTISAWAEQEARSVMAAQAARLALRCLAVLADFKKYMSIRVERLPGGRPLPPVVQRAVRACRLVSGELTPLAAVAGAVADEVADFTIGMGADKVIVNNGGDIALRLAAGQSAKVAVKTPAPEEGGEGEDLGLLHIKAGDGIGGVASSGWQGRSLSSGVADLVSVWAASAALADAAATHLANQVYATGGRAVRRPAKDLQPDSGLGEQEITVRVPPLEPEEKRLALKSGREAAMRLAEQGVLQGCLIYVQGDAAMLNKAGRLALDSHLHPQLPSES